MVSENLLSPIPLAFAVIIIGYYLGKIKIFGISLDLSGVLIFAVLVGWFLRITEPIQDAFDVTEYQAYMKFFSTFGTALFVSSIGITTGYALNARRWQDMKAALIGCLMVVSAFVTMKIITLFDGDISISKLLGSLCGALTTTPGLSAACELKNVIQEEVTLGYGSTYLFGVVAAVLFVQIATRKTSEVSGDNYQEANEEGRADFRGFMQIGLSVFIGRLIGGIGVFGFSLGNSGGMLCAGIIIGLVIKTCLPEEKVSAKIVGCFRNMGLVLFFVGNGIPAGIELGNEFEVKIVLYGVMMTIVPILIGVLLYRVLFKDGISATVVAGGMTSTPAVGVLLQKRCNADLGSYSFAYVGALITTIALIQCSPW